MKRYVLCNRHLMLNMSSIYRSLAQHIRSTKAPSSFSFFFNDIFLKQQNDLIPGYDCQMKNLQPQMRKHQQPLALPMDISVKTLSLIRQIDCDIKREKRMNLYQSIHHLSLRFMSKSCVLKSPGHFARTNIYPS